MSRGSDTKSLFPSAPTTASPISTTASRSAFIPMSEKTPFNCSGFRPAGKRSLCAADDVSGIGPKSALGILSALPVSDLVSAIQSGDVEKLETVPGIGKKSAGRLVLELKDKLIKLHPGCASSRPCHHRTRRNLRRRAFGADQFGLSWHQMQRSAETGSEITVRVVELQELIREVERTGKGVMTHDGFDSAFYPVDPDTRCYGAPSTRCLSGGRRSAWRAEKHPQDLREMS